MSAARAFIAPSTWLRENDLRLDAAAFGEGGQAARDRIREGPWEVLPLGEVARLFNGRRFHRHYVSDPARGTPFLSSSDMLLADPDWVPLLSIARTPFLKELLVDEGTTLISCSGTIGNTTFVRSYIAGWAASQHVMRAAPNGTVPAGYLFAFLSSSFAQAMIRQKTYGSVVQHIEPHHIEDLPVPVPTGSFGARLHDLVTAAASARTEAARLLQEASSWFDAVAPLNPFPQVHSRAIGIASRAGLAGRLDAFHHIGWAATPVLPGTPLNELATVGRPGIIRRVAAERGVPFVSGIDVYQVRPEARQRIVRRDAIAVGALVTEGTVVVQRSGQRYGLLGRPAYIGRRLDGFACSEDLIRVGTSDRAVAARIVAFLSSERGRRTILRHSYGTSIPHLNPNGVGAVQLPDLPDHHSRAALLAIEMREQADADEELAIREVEQWLAS